MLWYLQGFGISMIILKALYIFHHQFKVCSLSELHITVPHVHLLLSAGGKGDVCCCWTHYSLQHAQTQEEVESNFCVHSEPCIRKY